MQMPDAAMAMDTGGFVGVRLGRAMTFDARHDVRVTFAAGVFGNPAVAFCDLDVIGIVAGGEIERMPETVLRLGRILADEIRRRMTVIACRHAAMAGIDPAIVLLLHDVAIHARLGIVREVGRALGIDESVSAHAEGQAHRRAQHYARYGCALHRQREVPRQP